MTKINYVGASYQLIHYPWLLKKDFGGSVIIKRLDRITR